MRLTVSGRVEHDLLAGNEQKIAENLRARA